MKQFENIIIGFGKGGKTLAGALRKAGQTTVLIERSKKMYGGTCINVACIPTKSLENSARHSALQGGSFEEKAVRYRNAIAKKRRLTSGLRQKNYEKLVSAGVEILTGEASFIDAHRILVSYDDGTSEEVQGDRIFINTGARPFLPAIDGLTESNYVYTSETLMELEMLPRQLVIIGGGYIGLEFASYFNNFGAEVTVIQPGEAFIPREDREVAQAVLQNLEQRGIKVVRSAQINKITDQGGRAILQLETKDGFLQLEADAVLAATGRRPNIEGLHPEYAGVDLTERGAVKVDKFLRTSASNIWAMGDVAGGLQFTYISLDDYRIVKDQLLGNAKRSTKNRGVVPYSVFLDPPLSRAGLSEAEAIEQGYEIKTARLAAAAIPKAQVLNKADGFLKAVIDAKTDRILGAHFFCAESHEMINLMKLAMDAGITYPVLRDAIFTHPTMSEAINDLFSAVS